jgi:guanyl-specific ribonuclease Sa
MQFLQPLTWLAAHGAAVGAWIDLAVPELGISGRAQVTDIAACPPIESGYGRVVLGTFTHISHDVLDLRLVGQAEPIGVTFGHPIWSLDRADWVKAGELRPGERVATQTGRAVVASLTPRPGAIRTYNLAVEGDHRYLVSAAGVVVHNANDCSVPENLHETLDRIARGERFPHRRDGSVFENREGLLPPQPRGYYKEYVHPTPGVDHAGLQRVVLGAGGEVYYTPDHYRTFIRVT